MKDQLFNGIYLLVTLVGCIFLGNCSLFLHDNVVEIACFNKYIATKLIIITKVIFIKLMVALFWSVRYFAFGSNILRHFELFWVFLMFFFVHIAFSLLFLFFVQVGFSTSWIHQKTFAHYLNCVAPIFF